MINFRRVLQLLCDLFTDVYSDTKSIKDINNLTLSFLYLINKRFNVVTSFYWSSTTNASNSSNAWNVNFNNGGDNNNYKTNTNYVRCVRPADNNIKFDYV